MRYGVKMAVKLLVLKSGEDVIADVHEMVIPEKENGEGEENKKKVIGYYLRHPCRVKLFGDKVEGTGKSQSPFKIHLTPWSPLSKDEVIPMVVDWVVTITEPVDQLKEMYEKGIENYENRKSESSGTSQQLTDSESD
jgi:hypothetical protein